MGSSWSVLERLGNVLERLGRVLERLGAFGARLQTSGARPDGNYVTLAAIFAEDRRSGGPGEVQLSRHTYLHTHTYIHTRTYIHIPTESECMRVSVERVSESECRDRVP